MLLVLLQCNYLVAIAIINNHFFRSIDRNNYQLPSHFNKKKHWHPMRSVCNVSSGSSLNPAPCQLPIAMHHATPCHAMPCHIMRSTIAVQYAPYSTVQHPHAATLYACACAPIHSALRTTLCFGHRIIGGVHLVQFLL
jgi:hypothetical protein